MRNFYASFQVLVTCLALLACPTLLTGQDSYAGYIQKTAIPLTSPDSLNTTVYQEVKNAEIIMVGEMHGTNEPAQFVYGLAQLILQHEDQVLVGIEIPDLQMDDNLSKEDVIKTSFFQSKNVDGRNGMAWLKLVELCVSNSEIELFFFDNSKEYEGIHRDKVMYLEVLKMHKKHPEMKIITLSGNLHNRLKPYKDLPTMGHFIAQDSAHFNLDKVISVDLRFSGGTMKNNVGNGLELTKMEEEKDVYNSTLGVDYMFMKLPEDRTESNTHIFYAREITYSDVIDPKLLQE